jgi:hypothetical protein
VTELGLGRVKIPRFWVDQRGERRRGDLETSPAAPEGPKAWAITHFVTWRGLPALQEYGRAEPFRAESSSRRRLAPQIPRLVAPVSAQ